jgi:putative Mg2+ transporter-C (MgtC) family protein
MISELELTARMGLAIVAGAILGWERETHNKPAGVKTHMLVALGSAGFMLAGMELHEQLVRMNQANNADLMKVLAGIVGGIGFLGAGSIIQSGGRVRGLTTAATIWVAAAVGIACSLGLYVLATVSVGLAMATLVFLGLMQRHFSTAPSSLAPTANQEPQDDGEV